MEQQSTTPPRRRLRRFRDFIGHQKRHKSGLKETQDYSDLQTDETTDLDYFVMSVPKNISYQEKMQRLSALADKVADVDGSDVICMAMWVPIIG